MNKNYMIYPMKSMRITCRYDEGSHRGHNVGVTDNLIDYPIDDGGKDTGMDPICCPCDEMRVTAVLGVGNATTNTVCLASTTPVVTPTFTDIAYMTLTHPNDSDIKDIKVGDIYKRGDIICHEGTDGATSNHIHMTFGRGVSTTIKQNSNGKFVMYGDAKKPEEVLFIDRSFTKELWGGYLIWKDLPEIEIVGTPTTRNKAIDQVEIQVNNLNARESYSTTSKSYGYIMPGIYDILDTCENEGYTWMKVEKYWIATQEGWTKFYPKEEVICDEILNPSNSKLPRLIFTCKQTGKYIIYLKENDKLYLD